MHWRALQSKAQHRTQPQDPVVLLLVPLADTVFSPGNIMPEAGSRQVLECHEMLDVWPAVVQRQMLLHLLAFDGLRLCSRLGVSM